MKDFISKYWFGLLVLVFVASCTGYNLYFSHQKEINKLKKEIEQEKEKRRKQHIEDSIKATPEYIDSVRKSEEYFAEWDEFRKEVENEEIVGYVYYDDTIYHSTFHSVQKVYKTSNKDIFLFIGYLNENKGNLRFVCNSEVRELGLKLCEECEETINTYLEYQDGELIKRDEAYKYVDDY